MSYHVTKEALVPILARCIIRHHTIEAIQNHPATVSERGGDATITEEFIALDEIRRYSDSKEMIQAAFERAIAAYAGALESAEKEIKELKCAVDTHTAQQKKSVPIISQLKRFLSK